MRQSTNFTLRTEMFVFGMLFLAILFDLSIFRVYVKDKAVLFSTFVGISFALRLLFSGEYYIAKIIPSISFSFVIYVEYLTILLIPYTLLLLAGSLYKKQISEKLIDVITMLVL